MKPSPILAARRAAASLLPPRVIDGPPGRNGAGVSCTVRPRNSNGFARERRLERADGFGDAGGAARSSPIAVEVELLVDVARPDDQVDPTTAHDVEHDQVLGEAERLVEGGDERRDHQPES